MPSLVSPAQLDLSVSEQTLRPVLRTQPGASKCSLTGQLTAQSHGGGQVVGPSPEYSLHVVDGTHTPSPLTSALQLRASGYGHLGTQPALRLHTRGIPRLHDLTAPKVTVLALNKEAYRVSSGHPSLAACRASVWSCLQCTHS